MTIDADAGLTLSELWRYSLSSHSRVFWVKLIPENSLMRLAPSSVLSICATAGPSAAWLYEKSHWSKLKLETAYPPSARIAPPESSVSRRRSAGRKGQSSQDTLHPQEIEKNE